MLDLKVAYILVALATDSRKLTFPTERQPLRVSVPVFWVRLSLSNISKSVKNFNVNNKMVKYSNYNLFGRHAPSRSNNSAYTDSPGHCDILTAELRIRHQLQNVCFDTNTKYSF